MIARAFLLACLALIVGCPLTVVDRGPCRRCERGGDCDDGAAACEECRREWCPDADPDAEPDGDE